jgi:hypothetical protein
VWENGSNKVAKNEWEEEITELAAWEADEEEDGGGGDTQRLLKTCCLR